jgi:hypothetical protein
MTYSILIKKSIYYFLIGKVWGSYILYSFYTVLQLAARRFKLTAVILPVVVELYVLFLWYVNHNETYRKLTV